MDSGNRSVGFLANDDASTNPISGVAVADLKTIAGWIADHLLVAIGADASILLRIESSISAHDRLDSA